MNKLVKPYIRDKWSAFDVATPTLWLDASDLTTLTYDASDRVSAWTCKAGTGRSFTQSTNDKKPGLTLVNGLHALDFDGTADKMSTTATLADIFDAGAKTILCTILTEARDAIYPIFWPSTGGIFQVRTSSAAFQTVNVDAGGADTITSGEVGAGDVAVVAVKHDGTNLTISANGESPVSGASGDSTNTTVTFHLGWNLGTTYFSGQICEIIAYDKVLDANSTEHIQRGLMRKWGAS